jgi:hypothetical protein
VRVVWPIIVLGTSREEKVANPSRWDGRDALQDRQKRFAKRVINENEIDWCSSNNSVPCAVRSISVPILVVAMQGHYFIRDGEYIYETSKSSDNSFIVFEGVTHGLAPCVPC